jgi:hypothetical protein
MEGITLDGSKRFFDFKSCTMVSMIVPTETPSRVPGIFPEADNALINGVAASSTD